MRRKRHELIYWQKREALTNEQRLRIWSQATNKKIDRDAIQEAIKNGDTPKDTIRKIIRTDSYLKIELE